VTGEAPGVAALVHRLLAVRPLTFMTARDEYILVGRCRLTLSNPR